MSFYSDSDSNSDSNFYYTSEYVKELLKQDKLTRDSQPSLEETSLLPVTIIRNPDDPATSYQLDPVHAEVLYISGVLEYDTKNYQYATLGIDDSKIGLYQKLPVTISEMIPTKICLDTSTEQPDYQQVEETLFLVEVIRNPSDPGTNYHLPLLLAEALYLSGVLEYDTNSHCFATPSKDDPTYGALPVIS